MAWELPVGAALRAVLVLSALSLAPSASLTATPCVAGAPIHSAAPRRLERRRGLRLRGGQSGGAVPELVIPDSFDKLGAALTVLAADSAAREAQVFFRAGNHSIGTEECNNMAVLLDRDDFRLHVRGEAGTTLAGSWRCAGGGGCVEHARLLDVALLAGHDYDGEFLHPGIMYGDCCIAVIGAQPWVFRDCEVQCSGTALRAYDDAHVTCERVVTGGSDVSKLPPTNIFNMNIMPPWLKNLLIESLDTRNKTTGLPLFPDSAMPRYGVTAWGRAHVQVCVRAEGLTVHKVNKDKDNKDDDDDNHNVIIT